MELTGLLLRLKTGSDSERRFAAEDLGDAGDAVCMPGLLSALGDASPAVREAVADAIVRLAGERDCAAVAELLASEDVRLRNLSREILGRAGSKSVASLLPLLAHPSQDVQKFAIDILAGLGGDALAAFPALAERLLNGDPNVAGAAAEAMARTGDPRAMPLLMARLRGAGFWLQCCVVEAVQRTGSPGDLERIRDEYGDELLPEARAFCLRYLGKGDARNG